MMATLTYMGKGTKFFYKGVRYEPGVPMEAPADLDANDIEFMTGNGFVMGDPGDEQEEYPQEEEGDGEGGEKEEGDGEEGDTETRHHAEGATTAVVATSRNGTGGKRAKAAAKAARKGGR